MLKSKDVIRGIIEDDHEFLVSFRGHDGYFHAVDEALRDRLRKAHRDGREISFTFDPALKILSID